MRPMLYPTPLVRIKIPFTPGLIPARIERLAREVSGAIRDHFLSGADVKDILKELALREILTAEINKKNASINCAQSPLCPVRPSIYK